MDDPHLQVREGNREEQVLGTGTGETQSGPGEEQHERRQARPERKAGCAHAGAHD